MGTRGQSRAVEGFSARLTGPAAGQYRVKYSAHLAGKGDTPVYESGQFCGTKGEGRALEGLTIWLESVY